MQTVRGCMDGAYWHPARALPTVSVATVGQTTTGGEGMTSWTWRGAQHQHIETVVKALTPDGLVVVARCACGWGCGGPVFDDYTEPVVRRNVEAAMSKHLGYRRPA